MNHSSVLLQKVREMLDYDNDLAPDHYSQHLRQHARVIAKRNKRHRGDLEYAYRRERELMSRRVRKGDTN